jgi:hypothetical protein
MNRSFLATTTARPTINMSRPPEPVPPPCGLVKILTCLRVRCPGKILEPYNNSSSKKSKGGRKKEEGRKKKERKKEIKKNQHSVLTTMEILYLLCVQL